MGTSSSWKQKRMSELLDLWEERGRLSPSEHRELESLVRDVGDPHRSALLRMVRRDAPGEAKAAEDPDEVTAASASASRVDAIMEQIHEEGAIRQRQGAFWGRVAAAAAGVALIIAVTALIAVNLEPRGSVAPVARPGDADSVAVADLDEKIGDGEAAAPAAGATLVVRFELVAPEASRVSLVGDFNGWDEDLHRLRDRDGDGVWEVEVPLRRGEVYTYNFLLDEGEWIPDPNAVNHIEDSFGGEKSVLNL